MRPDKIGPDLGPNCLQRLSADDASRQRVNSPIQRGLSFMKLKACYSQLDLTADNLQSLLFSLSIFNSLHAG